MKDKLIQLKACEEAIKWAGDKSWEEIYYTCERGDWLLWLFLKTNPDDLQLLTLAKGHCANTVRHLMKDERSIKAVDTAIAFGEGNATKEELVDATYAAYAATYTPAYVAYAAAYAAYAAAYDSDTAAAAAYAAAYAVYAVYADATYADKKENQKLTADICRKYLPIEIWKLKTK